MVMRPSSASIMRKSSCSSVDLPEPVRPTTPTFVRGSIVKLTSFTTSGSSLFSHPKHAHTDIACLSVLT